MNFEKVNIDNTVAGNLTEIWSRVTTKFIKSYGQNIFNSWLKAVTIGSIENGFVTLVSPSRFVKDWVSSNYIFALEKFFSEEIHGFKRIDIVTERVKPASAATIVSASETLENSKNVQTAKKYEQAHLPLDEAKENTYATLLANRLDARMNFDNFVAFEGNVLARQAAENIATKDIEADFMNPLFIHGRVGFGKTHLLQACANQAISEGVYKNVLYLSAEKFMFGYVRAMKENKLIDFKDFVRSADLLLVDDIQFICGKNNFQEEFFHTINAVIEAGGKVVISADRSPQQMQGLDDRIKSRLSGGLIADIKSYSDEQRLEILRNKKPANVNIPESILKFVADNVSNSVRELEGALNKIIQISKLTGKQIDFALASEVVKASYAKAKKEVTLESIKDVVCQKFSLSKTEIDSATRLKKISEARQIAMYLAKKLTTKSLPDIGRFFGGKDHATVIHAVKKIEKSITEISEINSLIQELTATLQS